MRKFSFLFVISIITVLFIVACSDGVESGTPPIADVALKKAKVSSSYAYFLSEDGTLFCSGFDTDASAYVQYQDKRNRIVARDVISFGTMVNGGYYITENKDLYLYNKSELGFLGYTKAKAQKKVLSGVVEVYLERDYMVWLNSDYLLQVVGAFRDTQYSLEKPLVLGCEVTAFACKGGDVLWVDKDGRLHSEGSFSQQTMDALQQATTEKVIEKIEIDNGYIVILCDGELWYWGDTNFWSVGETRQESSLTKLADDIVDFECSFRTLGAKNKNGSFLLWGRCIANDQKETNTPQYEFFQKQCIAQQVKSIFVWDSCAGYIHENGTSHIFHSNMGWSSFYGNSTDAMCVGIYNVPRTWVQKTKDGFMS